MKIDDSTARQTTARWRVADFFVARVSYWPVQRAIATENAVDPHDSSQARLDRWLVEGWLQEAYAVLDVGGRVRSDGTISGAQTQYSKFKELYRAAARCSAGSYRSGLAFGRWSEADAFQPGIVRRRLRVEPQWAEQLVRAMPSGPAVRWRRGIAIRDDGGEVWIRRELGAVGEIVVDEIRIERGAVIAAVLGAAAEARDEATLVAAALLIDRELGEDDARQLIRELVDLGALEAAINEPMRVLAESAPAVASWVDAIERELAALPVGAAPEHVARLTRLVLDAPIETVPPVGPVLAVDTAALPDVSLDHAYADHVERAAALTIAIAQADDEAWEALSALPNFDGARVVDLVPAWEHLENRIRARPNPRDEYLATRVFEDATTWQLDDVDLASLANGRVATCGDPGLPAMFVGARWRSAAGPALIVDCVVRGGGLAMSADEPAASAELLAARRRLANEDAAAQCDARLADIRWTRLGDERMATHPRLRTIEVCCDAGTARARRPSDVVVDDLVVRCTEAGPTLVTRDDHLPVILRPSLPLASMRGSCGTLVRLLYAFALRGTAEVAAWSWGAIATRPFLPRVYRGDIVLAPARWLVQTNEVRELCTATDPFAAVRDWAERLRMPRFIEITGAVYPLPIDLDDPISVNALLSHIAKLDVLVLRELIPVPDGLWLRGSDGHHAHRVIVPLRARA